MNITLLPTIGLRAEWSPDGARLLYHKRGREQYYGLYADDTCLAHDSLRHAGNGSWSPDGKMIAFQAGRTARQSAELAGFSHPGIGFDNDLWLMTSDGLQIWQLTDNDEASGISAVLHPHFSRDGSRLSWSERIGAGSAWGEWRIVVADLDWSEGEPALVNHTYYQPGQKRYYESNDFSADGRWLLICGNLQPLQPDWGMDVYLLELATGEARRLTHSRTAWDESGHFSPDHTRIAWISSGDYPAKDTGRPWWETGRAEVWLMGVDGKNKVQLTHLNEYAGVMGHRVMVEYISWHPDGKSILASLIVETEDGILFDRILSVEL